LIIEKKLLTPTKKYLINVINILSRFKYIIAYCSIRSNCYKILQILPQQKKELKDRYSLLNGNLFTPLGSNNFITTTKTNSNIPKLIFDSWNFLNSDYISEGLKHLIKDVKYFES
jgi:hypothetical protein